MSKKEDDYYDKKIDNELTYDEKAFDINQKETDAKVTFVEIPSKSS